MGNCYVIVIDGLGVGAQEDAAEYGDEYENTLGHVCEETGCRLPNFQRLGLVVGFADGHALVHWKFLEEETHCPLGLVAGGDFQSGQ